MNPYLCQAVLKIDNYRYQCNRYMHHLTDAYVLHESQIADGVKVAWREEVSYPWIPNYATLSCPYSDTLTTPPAVPDTSNVVPAPAGSGGMLDASSRVCVDKSLPIRPNE